METKAVELLKCEGAFVCFFDVERDELCHRRHDTPDEPLQRVPTAGSSVIGHVFQTQLISNLIHTNEGKECRELETIFRVPEVSILSLLCVQMALVILRHPCGHCVQVRTVLCVPLSKPDGGPFGALLCINKHGGRRFNRDDEGMARNIGAQGGSMLFNVHQHSIVLKERAQAQALLKITKSLNSTLEIDALAANALTQARELTSSERGTLFLVDDVSRQLYSKLADGVTEIRISIKHGVAGWAATHGETVNIKNAYEDERFDKSVDQRTGFHTRSILCMPIKSRKGEVIGVTQLINKRDDIFGPEDERTLEAFTQQVSVALENSRLYQRVMSLYTYLCSLQARPCDSL